MSNKEGTFKFDGDMSEGISKLMESAARCMGLSMAIIENQAKIHTATNPDFNEDRFIDESLDRSAELAKMLMDNYNKE